MDVREVCEEEWGIIRLKAQTREKKIQRMPLFKIMAECSRCGKCCIIEVNGKWEDCRNLAREGGQTTCKIYDKRIGEEIGIGQRCDIRKRSRYDYPDCPYNNNMPIHPHYAGERKIVDEVCVMELAMRKWSDGVEDLGIKCQEELMTKHKEFLVRILTKAINYVMGAKASQGMIQRVQSMNKELFRRMLRKKR